MSVRIVWFPTHSPSGKRLVIYSMTCHLQQDCWMDKRLDRHFLCKHSAATTSPVTVPVRVLCLPRLIPFWLNVTAVPGTQTSASPWYAMERAGRCLRSCHLACPLGLSSDTRLRGPGVTPRRSVSKCSSARFSSTSGPKPLRLLMNHWMIPTDSSVPVTMRKRRPANDRTSFIYHGTPYRLQRPIGPLL